ncbi:MAG: cupin domain-containing protein [Woeseia sp.]
MSDEMEKDKDKTDEPEGPLDMLRRKYSSGERLPGKRDQPYLLDTEDEGVQAWANVHEGKGLIDVKVFPFERGSLPANFLTYDIPPGASEGVHTHQLNDPVEGSFDEFYYIVSGEGQMEIGDEIVPVKAGDYVFTPIGVPHGIENTSSTTNLKVSLTFIYR